METLSITKKVLIIDQKEFGKTELDLRQEVFVIHIATFTISMPIHLAYNTWIATLFIDKTIVIIVAEYSNFVDIFSKKSVTVLLEYTEINIFAIDLK